MAGGRAPSDGERHMKRICVFCGSSMGASPAFAEGARALGRALAEAGITLVYGGGGVGLMGVLADAVLEAGGEVIGVIPRPLWARELGHTGLTALHVVDSMHQRKALMAELSDGFIALPGGAGTLEEFAEMWTWGLLGVHRKPCGLLEVNGYYAPLLALLDHMVAQGFLRPEHRDMVLVESDPRRLLERFATYEPPVVARWLDRAEL